MAQDDEGQKRRPGRAEKVPPPTSAAAPPRGIALRPLKPAQDFKKLNLTGHRALAGAFRKVAERVAADPDFSVMLAINPVLALEGYGVTLTPELRDHVLRTVQYRGPVRERYDALMTQLTETLGARPRPDDATWLAQLVFVKLKLAPRDTTKAEPAYKAPLNADILARLEKLRPPRTVRYPNARPSSIKSQLAFTPWREAARNLDLDAPVPALPAASKAPEQLSLDQLWFYKDQHKVVHDVLELGIIQRSAFRVHTPDSFRRVAEGEKRSAFRLWIKSIRFKDRKP